MSDVNHLEEKRYREEKKGGERESRVRPKAAEKEVGLSDVGSIQNGAHPAISPFGPFLDPAGAAHGERFTRTSTRLYFSDGRLL